MLLPGVNEDEIAQADSLLKPFRVGDRIKLE